MTQARLLHFILGLICIRIAIFTHTYKEDAVGNNILVQK